MRARTRLIGKGVRLDARPPQEPDMDPCGPAASGLAHPADDGLRGLPRRPHCLRAIRRTTGLASGGRTSRPTPFRLLRPVYYVVLRGPVGWATPRTLSPGSCSPRRPLPGVRSCLLVGALDSGNDPCRAGVDDRLNLLGGFVALGGRCLLLVHRSFLPAYRLQSVVAKHIGRCVVGLTGTVAKLPPCTYRLQQFPIQGSSFFDKLSL